MGALRAPFFILFLNIFIKKLKFLTVSSYHQFISFLILSIALILKPSFAETFVNASKVLTKSNECLNDFQYQLCSNLILKMEKIQLVESEQNRYKCQSSILGLQTELIEAYSFKNVKKGKRLIMTPYVIKNCKFLK